MMLIPLRLPIQDEPLPSDCHILLRLVLPVSILSGAMIGLAIAQVRCRPKAPFQVGGKSTDGVHTEGVWLLGAALRSQEERHSRSQVCCIQSVCHRLGPKSPISSFPSRSTG